MATLTPTPDAVSREALTLGADDLARWLQEHLGQKLAAHALGLKDPKMVGRYGAGTHHPRDAVLFRMQAAYVAGRLLDDAFGPVAAKSWFFGSNRMLGDRAPAMVLREADAPGDLDGLMPAVRAFVSGDPS